MITATIAQLGSVQAQSIIQDIKKEENTQVKEKIEVNSANTFQALDTITAQASIKKDLPPPTLKAFLKQGKFSGQVRNLFMYTNNEGDLPDYHSLALGTGLGYESAMFHGFQVGVSGFFIFNVWSSNLGTDPETGFKSRYEIGNFDLLDPDDRHDLGRLENLYLRYSFNTSKVTVGRQKINTPFINPQDGRMRPTLVNGIWVEYNELEKLSFNGGYIIGFGPRSTADWFSVEESIGSIPAARSVYGKPSQYVGNINSDGVAIANVTYQPTQNIKTVLWHYYVDNLFNLSFSQTDVAIPVNQDKSRSIVLGFQAGYQKVSGNGGNADSLKAYMPKGAETWLYSGRLGFKTKKVETSLNYTQIADKDRFLFPREWGIEPFYTFLPRERFEGGAAGKGIALKTDLKLHPQWKASIGYGLFDTPSVKNARQSKYAMPSYSQLNIMANYALKGYLDGLVLQGLYVYKGARGETFGDPRFIENKVNMSHYTFVMNYQF
ncbi:hypothetical protein GCM10027293_19080 [Pontibacter aydingkolensis]